MDRLRRDENIRRDKLSGAYYAETLTDDGWRKLGGARNSYDSALTALVESRSERNAVRP